MTEPTTPDRRANDQWIRDAHKEQKEAIEALSKQLADFMAATLAAIPNKDPKKHLSAHEQWELDFAERKAKEENDAKLKLEVRNGLVKTGINAAIVFLGGVMLLGAQAQFGLWVEKAQAPKVSVETSKKESK